MTLLIALHIKYLEVIKNVRVKQIIKQIGY